MLVEIERATVLTGHGPDLVTLKLKTPLPCPFVPAYLPSQPPLELEFRATAGKGAEYCREVLGIDPRIVNV